MLPITGTREGDRTWDGGTHGSVPRAAHTALQQDPARQRRDLSKLIGRGAVVIHCAALPLGECEFVSSAVISLTGYSPEDFYAKPRLLRALVHPDYRERFERCWHELLAGRHAAYREYVIVDRTGRARRLSQEDTLIRDSSGRPRAVESMIYEIRANGCGDSLGAVATLTEASDSCGPGDTEVAAHLAIVAYLRGSANQLRVLTDHLPAAVSYIDNSERYRFNNRTYEEWFGRKPAEIYGKSMREVLGEAAYAAIRDKVQAVLAGETVNFEMSVPYTHGGTRYVRADYVPYRDERGDVQGFYALIDDISDSKRIEAVERRHVEELAHAARLASVGEMATQLIHEFTQPLAALTAYSRGCEMLLDRGELDSAKEMAAKARERAEATTEIVRSLRRFVQKRAPETRRIDIRAPVAAAVQVVRWDAEARHVPLKIETPDDLPLIEADPTLIEQVVINLLRNALDVVEERPQGGESVKLAVAATQESIEVSVSDYGPGLTPEAKTRLFEPFFTTKPQGVGIGLVICRRIVESHGGRLWGENNPDGRGARFRFVLPRVAAES